MCVFIEAYNDMGYPKVKAAQVLLLIMCVCNIKGQLLYMCIFFFWFWGGLCGWTQLIVLQSLFDTIHCSADFQ